MCKLAFLDLSVKKEEFLRGVQKFILKIKKLMKIFKCGSFWLKFRKSVADANENFKSLNKSADFKDKKNGTIENDSIWSFKFNGNNQEDEIE